MLCQCIIDQITHIQVWMQSSKEKYARKRIHNSCLVRIENSITRDNCLASISKPPDAEQLPSLQNFQFEHHNHPYILAQDLEIHSV